MLSKNTTFTILNKFIILLANFFIVVLTTRIWGSTGRGEIALVLANISIIAIVSNIFCGSTVAYHAPKLQRDFLLGVSLGGSLLVSGSGAAVFSFIFGFKYFLPLFLISFIMSMLGAVSMYWLGRNDIKKYNFLTLISPVFILTFLIVLCLILRKKSIETCFQAYYFGTATALIISIAGLSLNGSFKLPDFRSVGLKSIFSYGINNEFNYFIQFINYRLSYFFIAKILGLAQLGVFSIVVSISESLWIISRSLSVIHFSNVINSDDRLKSRHDTNIFARQSLWISLLFMVIAVAVPSSVYQFVFGSGFTNVKIFIIYLLPGIVAIAVSNLYGHYFAGIGKLIILRNKSFIGLGATLILLPLLIKKYQLTGVCISLNVSYILSSLYLWINFRKEGKNSVQNIPE
jgi:O-antigen/teichoic acid export membrane protein